MRRLSFKILVALSLATAVYVACSIFERNQRTEYFVPDGQTDPWAAKWSNFSFHVRGWPSGYRRVFDQPSGMNNYARFDGQAFTVDVIVWLILIGLCFAPLITVLLSLRIMRYLRTRSLR